MTFQEPFQTDISSEPVSDDPQYLKALQRLKLVSAEAFKQRKILYEEFGASLNDESTLVARVKFLADAIWGIDTPERLEIEAEWLEKHIIASIEQSKNMILQQKASSQLHIPGKGVHVVKPLENGNDSDYGSESTGQ